MVPTGREEIWRFTPLKRLNGLHADAEFSGPRPRVHVEHPRGRPRRGRRPATRPARCAALSGLVPNTRFAARVLAEVPSTPAGRRARRHRGRRADRRRPGRRRTPTIDRGRPRRAALRRAQPRRPWCSTTPAPPRMAAGRRGRRSATAPSVTVVSLQDWADDAVHLDAPPGPRRPRRDVQARGDHLRRRRRADGRQRDVRRSRRLGRAARPLLRRRRPAHRAPALRRPHRAAHQEPRRLQGRAAGRGRAHGLGRQRADPQGRRGHRDLRGEPQPGPHRRLPGRLGPQPGDRDRRDRGCRARLGHRSLRRRAAVLPAVARHRRAGGAPPGRARLLQRPDPQGRRPLHRGAAARPRSRPSSPRTSCKDLG